MRFTDIGWLCAVLVVFASVVFAGEIDVVSYDMQVSFDPESNRVDVTADVHITKPDDIDEFMMLFSSFAGIKSIQAKTDGSGNWSNMHYSFGGQDSLYLGVQPDQVEATELILRFVYALQFTQKSDRLALDRGHRWYPMIADDNAIVTIIAEVPDDFIVIASGNLIEEDTYADPARFVWETAIPVFKIPIIFARSNLYEITKIENTRGDKEIYFYNSGMLKDQLVDNILNEAAAVFDFFSDRLGDYPHSRLTLMDDSDLQGANVSTGLMTLGKQYLDSYRQGQYETLHVSIAQQWFGSGVFGRYQGKGFWLPAVIIPQHARMLMNKEIIGEDVYVREMQAMLAQYHEIEGSRGDIPIIDIDQLDSQAKGMVIYAKGPYVLDVICRQIGDGAYWQMLNDIYRDFLGRVLTYQDFMTYVANYDPDGTLETKIRVMLSQPGLMK